MFKVKVLNQKIFRKIPKSISAFSPPPTKSAAIWSVWGGELATRYPGVCRVCAITMFVFEQIRKYCDRLRPFLNFFEKLMFKVKVLNQKIFRKIPKSISAFSPPPTKSAAIWCAWGGELATRYPGVCRVCAIMVFVFEQIRKYCDRLRPFLNFFELYEELNLIC
jgi:hypothetical protein